MCFFSKGYPSTFTSTSVTCSYSISPVQSGKGKSFWRYLALKIWRANLNNQLQNTMKCEIGKLKDTQSSFNY